MNGLTKATLTQQAYDVVAAAIEVHNELGPGLLERIYEECLLEELRLMGFEVQQQVAVPISYRGRQLSTPLRLDVLVNQHIIVEIKAVKVLLPVHEAQVLSYMKLARKPRGILLNFNVERITKAAKHYVNGYYAALPA